MPKAEAVELGEAQDMIGLDEDTLDSSMEYRFVQSRPKNVARREAQGWQLVSRKDHGVRLASLGVNESADDLIRVGDTVLMMAPKDKVKKRREQIQKVTRERLSSGEDQFKSRAKTRGVRSLTGDEGERK